jgi:putative spermidine/putrescine transport system substrate-binding protein
MSLSRRRLLQGAATFGAAQFAGAALAQGKSTSATAFPGAWESIAK